MRSAFFAVPEAERFARARLDRQLRDELRSQLPFRTAYRLGLAELLRERTPQSAAALSAALAIVGTVRYATPSRWAYLWSRFLLALGWQPPVIRAAFLGWQSSLDELGRASRRYSAKSRSRPRSRSSSAFLDRPVSTALPVVGYVLGRMEDVGPGYAAVWITGLTDSAWPQPPHGQPLLPLALQRAHDMPYSSPRDAQRRSAQILERLTRRTPELVASWPARVFDYPTEPSPAIRMLPELAPGNSEEGIAMRSFASRAQRARETLADAPPAVAGRIVTGGVGALNRQARCPLRAFCEYRLAAKELEPVSRGLPARIRGIAAHRALELLLQTGPAQADLARITRVAIDQCVEQALVEGFLGARAPLRALFELERERLGLIGELLERDARRGPFCSRLGGATRGDSIRTVDAARSNRSPRRLAAGGIAIIDYKTDKADSRLVRSAR